ncbi:protein of unknown function DUF433 [Caldicellulosiruptor acetigenus I77R1B]|uniref:DUF433 domain-containing protein n=2 Tax=Caldicellulosiruptor acetigenus TaxID=301953 RepID=G2PT93_9FIRM|nr:DUF433 domain-containing protein [Caldicellulosiruptor acetigenus]ADQ40222.1 protein of unknown function DUF433 [Caldicellulosiruptor acetigenus I77R1B]AEM74252.1 protein of unknown function DUF433 [Caldicellulosiruptor acetigenus 6A]
MMYCMIGQNDVYEYFNRNVYEYKCNEVKKDNLFSMYERPIFKKYNIISQRNTLVKHYLYLISKRHNSISVDEDVLSGMPCIKGRRIPVSLILSCIKEGISIEEICEEYLLNKEDVVKALEYVIDVLDYPYQEEEDEVFVR